MSHVKHEVICKRLERANVVEALLVLSHGDEEQQVLKMEASSKVGEHEHKLEGARVAVVLFVARVAVVRLVARKSGQLVHLVEQRSVASCVFLRELPIRSGVGRVLRQKRHVDVARGRRKRTLLLRQNERLI